VFNRLAKKASKLDAIIIESTGMADPCPVAQTFVQSEEVKKIAYLDAVIGVVDAKHIMQHLDETKINRESAAQIAFSDRLLISKIDLVTKKKLLEVKDRIRKLNPHAEMIDCNLRDNGVDLAKVLNTKLYDIKNSLNIDPDFLTRDDHHDHHDHEDVPIEEIGKSFSWAPSDPPATLEDQVFDPKLQVTYKGELRLANGIEDGGTNIELHVEVHDHEDVPIEQIGKDFSWAPSKAPATLEDQAFDPPLPVTYKGKPRLANGIEDGGKNIELQVNDEDDDEMEDAVATEDGAPVAKKQKVRHSHGHHHHHDDGITTVGFKFIGEMDNGKLNAFLGQFLQEKGPSVYRMKGIIAMQGMEEKFIFQGVHMLFDARPDEKWGPDEEKLNKFIFIGRDLNEKELRASFMDCLAT